MSCALGISLSTPSLNVHILTWLCLHTHIHITPVHYLYYLTSLFWYVYSLPLPHYSNIHNKTVYHLLIVLMVPQCLLLRYFFHAHYTGISISACSSNGIQRFHKCNCSIFLGYLWLWNPLTGYVICPVEQMNLTNSCINFCLFVYSSNNLPVSTTAPMLQNKWVKESQVIKHYITRKITGKASVLNPWHSWTKKLHYFVFVPSESLPLLLLTVIVTT